MMFEAVVLTFHCLMPGATEFSDWATTDRGCVSGNTSGYKVRASIFSTLHRLSLPVELGEKVNNPVIWNEKLSSPQKLTLTFKC